MSEYGFKKVLSLDEYASYFKDIDPVSLYKIWTKEYQNDHLIESAPRYNVLYDRVKAAFVVSDPVDWGLDIQVLCDILTSEGLPGGDNGHQPPLYFAAADLEYQSGSVGTQGQRCKLLDGNCSRNIVAYGYFILNDSKDLVIDDPIGPFVMKVGVDFAREPDAFLWRPTSGITCIEESVGSVIAWPADKVIMSMLNATQQRGY
ncbi:uncharacterized protein LOC133834744 [Humulus lupulus]|uniref:uncharacterized protein LOC133834744 n=1 Tax=Humulus lupulus TaxID=3486 RepID=UPI002B40DFBD|nr:uncharacterized protein LOC133834744 [Humulus lupulus]